ncbi:transmembrane amino acid transporter protein-domain-containing protein [Usnea florida]
MPKDRPYDLRDLDVSRETDQSRSLLSQGAIDDEDGRFTPAPPFPHSSFSRRPALNGFSRTPRTIHRVRFDVGETDNDERAPIVEDLDPAVAENDFSGNEFESMMSSAGQRAPLLTDVEAPSVVVAEDLDFDPEQLLENKRPTSNIISAFMNMANSIIGAGIIGQPYAFRQAGLSAGIVLLVILTITVDWTIRLIVVNSKLSGANSFQGTVQHCFGASGLIAISIAQWAFAFGGMVAFCVIMGDTIPSVIAALFPSLSNTPFLWLLTNRRAVIIMCTLGFSYPLSLYRDIAKLAKASTLALLSMSVILVTVVTQGIGAPQDLRGDLHGSLFVRTGVLQAISVISFDHNSLLIYGSLEKPTMDRFARVTHYSTFTSMLACLTMALAGFVTFGDKTRGNILNNFPRENLIVNIARFLLGANMVTTLPLGLFALPPNFWFPNEPYSPNLHLIFTTSLVVTAMALSLITCDLGAVFELVVIANRLCKLAYILPPLCYIKLSSRSWKVIPAILCVIFGIIVMIISLIQAVTKMIRNEGGAHICR